MSDVPTLRLRRNRPARVLRGHLWVYAGELEAGGRPAPDGAEVRLVDAGGRLLGRGLFNSASAISLRLFTAADEPLDEEFFRRRLRQALAFRERLWPGLPAGRLVFSEGDLWPGLIVDRYGEVLVVQYLTLGMDLRRELVNQLLIEELRPAGLFDRSDASVRLHEGLLARAEVVHGEVPERLAVQLAGLVFEADVRAGQKTALFLDQRENYDTVRALARGQEVLDAFSHTGGFALAAAAGGAHAVTAVEISEEAVAALARNARANALAGLIDPVRANAFDHLRALEREKRAFDLVVLDPPSFCKSRQALPAAQRGYREINLRAMKLLRPGGILVTNSCSYHLSEAGFLEVVEQAARDARRLVRVLEVRAQARDHPRLLQVPETHYLKCLVLQIL